jgi:hypothetical protein
MKKAKKMGIRILTFQDLLKELDEGDASDDDDESLENLRKFLESDDPAMVRMGLSMAKGSGVPLSNSNETLLPTILGLYMWDDDKNVRAAAKSVFTKYAPAEIQVKVKENWKASYRTLLITGDRFQEAVRPFVQAFKSQAQILIELQTLAKDPNARQDLGNDFAEIALVPLIKALGDGGWDVRWRAAEALGKIGDARAVEPLIGMLSDDNQWVRYYAAEALGEIGDTRAVEPLITALGDEDEYVRGAAKEALRKLGNTEFCDWIYENDA